MPTAFITGATSGIGAAFARRLARDGMSLALLARNGERLQRVAEDHRRAHGVDVEVLVADLASDEGITAAERRLDAGVDLLVNNAGFGLDGRYLEVPVSDELAMLRVHCEAVLRLTSAAMPAMIQSGSGGVINVASVAAFFARGTYSASKAWVVSFSQSVREDVAGTGVRVMALCPGWVRTEFHERARMDMSGLPDFVWLDADKLVASAMRDYRRGVGLSVPGGLYKALLGLNRVIPRRLSSRVSARMGRRYD
jgi:short-subunit dehydrogenase